MSPAASAKKNVVFRSGKRDKIQLILAQESSEKSANVSTICTTSGRTSHFSSEKKSWFFQRKFSEEVLCVFAVRLVRQKTIEEVETHVRRFAADGVWPSPVHKLFGRGLNGLHRGTRKNGCLFEVRSVWGAEVYTLNIINLGLEHGYITCFKLIMLR